MGFLTSLEYDYIQGQLCFVQEHLTKSAAALTVVQQCMQAMRNNKARGPLLVSLFLEWPRALKTSWHLCSSKLPFVILPIWNFRVACCNLQ